MELNETIRNAIGMAVSFIDSGNYECARSLLCGLLSGEAISICEYRIEDGCRNEENRIGLCHPSHCPVSSSTEDWVRLKYGQARMRTTPVQVLDGFVRRVKI